MAHEPENLDEQISGSRSDNHGKPVTVAEARSEFEASVLVSVLADAGIEAHSFARFRQALPFQSHFSRIPIQVRASDAEAAKEALAQRTADSVDIDWDEVDVGEREDDLPLGKDRRASLAMRIGISLTIVIIIVSLFAALAARVL